MNIRKLPAALGRRRGTAVAKSTLLSASIRSSLFSRLLSSENNKV
jgi:hypothetical protein